MSNWSLADFVAAAPEATPRLPYTHICDVRSAKGILSTLELRTSSCTRMGEDLLYAFYGRPAYRVNPSVPPTRDEKYWPICFLIDGERFLDVRRVVPFDSGQFVSGAYTPMLHAKSELDEYLLWPTIDTPPRAVTQFYGTNESYYDLIAQMPATHRMLYEARDYVSLVMAPHPLSYDDRRGTIELQSTQTLPLGPGVVKLVVGPHAIVSAPDVAQIIIHEWGAEFRGYHAGVAAPSALTDEIRRIVRDYLEADGYF